ncbi:filamentous hemagglutinin N-terminal domain-containing protein [Verrucomicrobium sp. GAS474]|uniref:filamentous hemagglutinin N-terminal domain-containing protein n=1 Tax=Verrucomicrobium sp. GAS474 TaxID=1882831 RepID=UPI0013905079|nr:filamentous hemagglutinin N-terminal domain-containing protein [Verrucomicrobium sp. GAS474]
MVGLSVTPWELRANPTGGDVVSGTANISSSGNTLTVVNSNGAVINWQDFSIGAGELTKFIQSDANSTVLNRVVGTNLSQIYGTLSSNGKVFLINPNGVMIGATGIVNTAGFMASTLDINNADFIANNGSGAMHFVGNSTAAITNLGTINAVGGDVYLIAKHIDNQGTVNASEVAGKGGLVGVYATDELYLTTGVPEGGLVRVGSGSLSSGAGTGINNSGLINAVQADLKATGNLYSLAINNTGVVRATGATAKNGVIHLSAAGGTLSSSGTLAAKNADGSGGTIKVQSGSGGTTLVNGTVDASATSGKGGLVELSGDYVALYGTGSVTASGPAGGGVIHIGGSPHGTGDSTVYNAISTYVGSDTTISADALVLGDGGQVTVWANDTTRFYGNITAKGAGGGSGGWVETSGHTLYADGHVDTNGGTWLLDPQDVYIGSYSTTGSSSSGSGFWVFSSGGGTGGINDATLFTALSTNDVIVSASGNIIVNGSNQTALMPYSHKLTLAADLDITFTSVDWEISHSGSYGTLSLVLTSFANGTNGNGGTATGGSVYLYGATIVTDGGSIVIGSGSGGTGSALGVASVNNYNYTQFTSVNGVSLTSGSTLDAGAGAITIRGAGASGVGLVADGVSISGSTVTATTGNILINGTGGSTSAGEAYGIYLNNGTVKATSAGTVTLNGTGGTAGTNGSIGIQLVNAVVQATGGQLQLAGAGADYGLYLAGGSLIKQAGVGNLVISGSGTSGLGLYANTATISNSGGSTTLSGYSAASGTPNGLNITNSSVNLGSGAVTLTANGQVTLTGNTTFLGTGVLTLKQFGGGNINLGSSGAATTSTVYVSSGSLASVYNAGFTGLNVVSTSGNISYTDAVSIRLGGGSFSATSGSVSIISTAGGVALSGFSVSAGSGVTINGTASASASTDTYGVSLSGSTVTTAAGTISISGTGAAATGHASYGIGIAGGSVLQASGTGSITLSGSGQSGNNSYGVSLSSSTVTLVDGTLSITGTAGTASDLTSAGVYTTTGSITATGSGAISIHGTGGQATGSNTISYGVQLMDGTQVSTSTGSLGISGSGGSSNYSIYGTEISYSFISTSAGTVSLDGTSHDGAYAMGLYLSGSTVTATGTGTVLLTGTGNSASFSYGVFLNGSTVRTNSGDLGIIGIGGQSGINASIGVSVSSSTAETTSGWLTISGTGGLSAAGGSSYGVKLYDSIVSNIGSGPTVITGYGGFGGTTTGSSVGVSIESATTISNTTSTITINGSGGATSGNSKNSIGVSISGSTVATTGSAAIHLSGTGGDTSGTLSGSIGVDLEPGAMVNLVDGYLTLTGTGGYATVTSAGIVGNGAQITLSGGGHGQITGNAGSGDLSYGIEMDTTTLLGNTNAIELQGYGNQASDSSIGIHFNGTAITHSGGIYFSGSGGSAAGTASYGIEVDGATFTGLAFAGGVEFDGTGGQSVRSYGVSISNATFSMVTTTTAFSASGTASLGSSESFGVRLDTVSISASGDITVSGTGGATSSGISYGVSMSGVTATSSSGNIHVDGTADASATSRYDILLSSTSLAATMGNLSLIGNAAGSINADGTSSLTAGGTLTVDSSGDLNFATGSSATGYGVNISASGTQVNGATITVTGSPVVVQYAYPGSDVSISGGSGDLNYDGAGTVGNGLLSGALGTDAGGVTISGDNIYWTGSFTFASGGSRNVTFSAVHDIKLGIDSGGTTVGLSVDNTTAAAASLTFLAGGNIYADTFLVNRNGGTQTIDLTFNAAAVSIQNSFFAGNGSISVTATAGGLAISNSTLAAGTGVTLNGTIPSVGYVDTFAVSLSNSTVTTTGGDIVITGTGTAISNGGTAYGNYGIYGIAAIIENTGTGDVTLNGTGAGNAANPSGISAGISLNSGSTLTTASGNIILNGTGGQASNATYGVNFDSTSTGSAAGTGGITITGTTATDSSGIYSFGINIEYNSGAVSLQTAAGSIALYGTGGASTYSVGVRLPSVKIQSGGGDITISGTGGVSTGAPVYATTGIDMFSAGTGSTISTTGTGSIHIDGTTQEATNLTTGVNVDSTSFSVVDGLLSISGAGGTAVNGSVGVALLSATLTASGSGAVVVNGTGGSISSGTSYGVSISGSTLTATTGDLSVTAVTSGILSIDGTSALAAGGALAVHGATDINLASGTRLTGRTVDLNAAGSLHDLGAIITVTGNNLSFSGTSGDASDDGHGNLGNGALSDSFSTSTGGVTISADNIYWTGSFVFASGGSHSVTFSATNNISLGINSGGTTVGLNVDNTTGTAASLTFNAGGNIYADTFMVNHNGGGNTAINLAFTAASGIVSIKNSILNSNGTISMIANAGGVLIDNASVLAQGGVTIHGTALTSTLGDTAGVLINNSAVSTDTGDIEIVGNGALATGHDSYGVRISGSSLNASGTATLHLTGHAGTGDNSYGVSVDSDSTLYTVDGQVIVSGTGSDAVNGDSYGISFSDSTAQGDGAGGFSFIGTGGTGGSSTGVYLGMGMYESSATVLLNAGTLHIEGTGATATNNESNGVVLSNASATVGGSISISGTGGTATNGYSNGVSLSDGTLGTTGTGTITITGVSHAAQYSYGVYIDSMIITAASNNLTINGTGGITSGGSSIGVYVYADSSTFTAGGIGNLQVIGVGGSGDDSTGIWIDSGTTLQCDSGSITLTGTGGAASVGDTVGVVLSSMQVASNGAGITISGTGDTAMSGNSYGIELVSSTVQVGGPGALTLNGRAGSGTNATGVFADSYTHLTAAGSGSIFVSGTGGTSLPGQNYANYGIYFTGTQVTATTGNIILSGTGGPTGTLVSTLGVGTFNGDAGMTQISTGGTGSITISGIGGVSSDATSLTVVDGNIAVTALNGGTFSVLHTTWNATGTGSIAATAATINGGGLIAMTASGNQTYTATGGGITLGYYNQETQFSTMGGALLFNGNFTLNANASVYLGGTVTGNLTVTSGGLVSQSSALVVGGDLNVTAGSGYSIALTNTGNLFAGSITIHSVSTITSPSVQLAYRSAATQTGGSAYSISGPNGTLSTSLSTGATSGMNTFAAGNATITVSGSGTATTVTSTITEGSASLTIAAGLGAPSVPAATSAAASTSAASAAVIVQVVTKAADATTTATSTTTTVTSTPVVKTSDTTPDAVSGNDDSSKKTTADGKTDNGKKSSTMGNTSTTTTTTTANGKETVMGPGTVAAIGGLPGGGGAPPPPALGLSVSPQVKADLSAAIFGR